MRNEPAARRETLVPDGWLTLLVGLSSPVHLSLSWEAKENTHKTLNHYLPS